MTTRLEFLRMCGINDDLERDLQDALAENPHDRRKLEVLLIKLQAQHKWFAQLGNSLNG